MKKLLILTAFFIAFLVPAMAGAQDIKLELFYGDGCPHCEKEMEFLEDLKGRLPGFDVDYYEVYNHPKNAALMRQRVKEAGSQRSGVPFLVIGDKAMVGYLSDETTGEEIKGRIMELIDRENALVEKEDKKELEKISLPFVGERNIKGWSLPFLTVVLAGLDGFNPCAMWVLLFLISLLLGMENRKKMWTLGLSFIAASALVYFLFLSAWLNLFLFIGFLPFVRIVIGAVAVGSGAYHLREWHCNKEGACKATGAEKKRKIMDRFKRVVSQKSFFLALAGIIALAFAVNMIELVCSAGLPAIYTHVLSLSGLSTPAYYLYLLLYVLIFMLDDMLIFAVAMVTLKMTGMSAKYSRWSNLIGGIVILLLGILLIFRPGWIMFG